MTGQTQGQGERALLTLGRLASGVARVQSKNDVVTVRTDGTVATPDVVA